MITEQILISLSLTLIQISSAYLRYLPFSRYLSREKGLMLVKVFLLWSIVGFVINLNILDDGVNYRTYKFSFAVNWMPYFLLSLKIIGQKFQKHVFVLGMQLLWSFMLHAFAGMIVALIYGAMSEEFLLLQLMFYMLLFIVLLGLERKFFINLMPVEGFFKNPSFGWIISIFPLAMFFGTIIQISDVTFLPTWRERFARMFLPIFFLLIYRLLILATRQVEEKQLHEEKTRLLSRQMKTIAENNSLMQKNQLEVTNLRENLYEMYSMLDNLLEKGQNLEAMQFIRRQTELLDTTSVKIFSTSPLINAALSMYFRRAEEFGIKITHKIDLPEKLSTDESDLAILLSNLLENAITASQKQIDPSRREISIIIRHMSGQYVLEITNRYDYEINLGENGLPYTTEIGHGFGMGSLELFANKYDAFIDFSHEDGVVGLNMYWNDYLCAK